MAPAGFSLVARVARVTLGARAPALAAAAGASPSVTTFLRRLLLCHDSRARQLLLGWDNSHTQCRHPPAYWYQDAVSSHSPHACRADYALKATVDIQAMSRNLLLTIPFVAIEVAQRMEHGALLAVALGVAAQDHLQVRAAQPLTREPAQGLLQGGMPSKVCDHQHTSIKAVQPRRSSPAGKATALRPISAAHLLGARVRLAHPVAPVVLLLLRQVAPAAVHLQSPKSGIEFAGLWTQWAGGGIAALGM